MTPAHLPWWMVWKTDDFHSDRTTSLDTQVKTAPLKKKTDTYSYTFILCNFTAGLILDIFHHESCKQTQHVFIPSLESQMKQNLTHIGFRLFREEKPENLFDFFMWFNGFYEEKG